MAMKKLLAPLVILGCIAVFASCSKDEVPVEPDPAIVNAEAKFEFTPGDDPFTFNFKNLSTKFAKLEWRFGDDTLRTSENPEHVYLTAGSFTVDLRAISETGAVSRFIKILDIVPDTVVKMKSAITAEANKVSYTAESIASITKAEWSIADDTRSGPAKITSITSLTPVFPMPPGRLTPVTLKVTTAKGSSATIVKNSSPAGLVKSFMKDMVKSTPSRDNDGNANERAVKLFDNVDSKFLINFNDVGRDWNIVMEFSKAHRMKFYCIGNGNDSPERDPKTWTMEGSNDLTNWTLVDSRNEQKHFTQQLLDRGFQNNDPDTDWKKFYFTAANPGSYKYYRMRVTSTHGDGLIQFGEITFFE